MRFTFAEMEAPARRNGLLVWARRAFDMVVIGALLLAAVETVNFLQALVS